MAFFPVLSSLPSTPPITPSDLCLIVMQWYFFPTHTTVYTIHKTFRLLNKQGDLGKLRGNAEMWWPLIAEERKSWNVIWILLTSRLISAWCLLSPVISKGNLHYLLVMKNDNDLHRLALVKESYAFYSKGTWKDCELFPACGSSAALFHEDVMVPLGKRTSHSLLSRLDHVCFLWMGAGRLSSYCCYLELMSTHLCSRCAPTSQLLQSQSDVAFDIPNVCANLLHLKWFFHYWWKFVFDFLVIFKLEEWV